MRGQVVDFVRRWWVKTRMPIETMCEKLHRHTLVGREFQIQGIRFHGIAECSPCYWMNTAFGLGAEDALRGRGGLRARILTNGVLRAIGAA